MNKPPEEATPSAHAGGPVWADARRSVIVGTAFALVGAALYGMNIPAARVASQAGMPGADLIFYRAIILVPLLAALAMGMGHSLRLRTSQRGNVLRLAIASSLTATFYLSALDHLSVPMTVVIFYTFPLMVMLISNRIEGRRLSSKQIGIFIVAFVGLVLAVGPSAEQISLRGAAYAVFAALACAGLFIMAGRVEGSPIRTMFWSQACVAPVALTFALLNGGPVSPGVFKLAPLAIFIAMAAFAVAFVFQLLAAQRISPSRTGLLFLLEPVTAIMIAGFFLGETLLPIQIGGVALILGALAAEILLDTPRVGPAGTGDAS